MNCTGTREKSPQDRFQQMAIGAIERRLELGLELLVGQGRRLQEARAEGRRDRHGENPRREERHEDDDRHRTQILTGRMRSERQGDEEENGRDRRGQQGDGQRSARIDRGLYSILSRAQPVSDLLCDYDAVVHEQAQGDDQGRERDPVHRDSAHVHEHERHDHREGGMQAHDQPGPDAEEAHDDGEHDGDRLEEVGPDAVHGPLDVGRLVVSGLERVADRQLGLELLHARLHAWADVEDVLPFHHGDAEEQGLLAVVVEGRLRWIDVAAGDRGQILQEDHLLRLRNRDGDVLDILDTLEITGRDDAEVPLAGIDGPARKQDVLGDERLADRGRREAELGQARRIELDPDHLLLDTVELNASDARNDVELVLDVLRDLVHLRQREAVGEQRDADHGDVAEVVVHEGTDDSVG
jgi:hypothetical protein